MQVRRFSQSQPAKYGGAECAAPDNAVQERCCNEHDCPVDCVVEMWENWGTCTRDGITAVTCNKGRQTRTRTLTPPRYGGKNCPAASDVRDCAMQCCAEARQPPQHSAAHP